MSEAVSLLAVGDLLLCGRYDAIADAGRAADVFGPLASRLAEVDVAVGNMECVLSTRGGPRRDKLCLRGRPSYAKTLAGAGFHVLSLANNHTFDYGLEGFDDTREHLEHAGVRTVGAGATAAAATEPVVLDRHGRRIAFLAFCHASTRPSAVAEDNRAGVARLDPEMVEAAVRRWRPAVDHLVLLLHWGLEYSPLPTPEQVKLAHEAVEAGADAVIGHHSHMLQGIETYKGAVIAYSLGNCTDSDVDWQGPEKRYTAAMGETDREGLALVLELGADGAHVKERHPLWLNDAGQPEPATGARARAILGRVGERSRALESGDLASRWEGDLVSRRVMGPLRHWWARDSLMDKVRGFRLSQLKTLAILVTTYARIRLSRSEERWSLFNPRNDDRPMPSAGEDRDDERP